MEFEEYKGKKLEEKETKQPIIYMLPKIQKPQIPLI